MSFRIKVAAIAVAALAVVGVGSSYAANASILNTPQYTVAGANSVAGWYGTANNGYFPTHIKAYLGSSGDSSLANLPVSDLTHVNGGLGTAFCDTNTGEAVQVGDIYIGNGFMDVVAGSGQFGAAINNNDRCQNGVVNPNGTNGTGTGSTVSHTDTVIWPANTSGAPQTLELTVASGDVPAVGTHFSTTVDGNSNWYVKSVTGNTLTIAQGTIFSDPFGAAITQPNTGPNAAASSVPATLNWTTPAFSAGQQFAVLLTNVPVNDTVQVDEQLNHGFSVGPASSVIVQAKDLSVNKPGGTGTFILPPGTVFNEVDAGVVADTQKSVSITDSVVPAVNTNATNRTAPEELARIAHFDISANLQGGHEFHGATATAGSPLATSVAFVGSPVIASVNGQANNGNNIKLNVSNWNEDNFYIQQGALVS